MALGLNLNSGGGSADIVPYCKYDSRAGRVSRPDRKEVGGQFVTETVDITNNFKAVFDMENVEVGYLNFAAGAAPQYALAALGDPMPQRPSADFKQGVRFMMKLHSDCGGDVREMSGNAASFLRGFDELHTAYEAGKAANTGKLPIVKLASTQPVTSGSGAKKSTNYQPVFEIVGWAPRPTDLVFVPKAVGTQIAAPSTAPAAPPSTGSTQVAPPAAKVLAPAGADDGFG